MRSALIASMILVTESDPALAQETLVDIQLEELWRVDDSHDLIGRVRDIEVDTSGNVYVLDQQLNLVHVYSADGTHLRNIGREGDGPGEFRRSQDLLITSEGLVGVLESVPGKIVLLDPDGVPAGQVPLPPQPDGATITLQSAGCAGGNLVIYHFQRVFGEQVQIVGTPVPREIPRQCGPADQHGAMDALSEDVHERAIERRRQDLGG